MCSPTTQLEGISIIATGFEIVVSSCGSGT